ncbi:single strand DNA binding protein [Bacillus phage Moonbeam]|uniref:SsDNA binding domain protein n=1 Tax=Bacillus phage Moonbeam TaxID=1540091 RepID=A0A0A0RPJ2_9CAUD|nr:single strand DNA binding protein [Bacillus phage Moonbeam]AIW03524.1 hypothetical protein CPT_Moonbeam126 [Bacillus phage Moonbeam]
MSFADLIKQAKAEVEQQTGGDNSRTVYPKAKHPTLFFGKDTPELLFQLLPSADLNSTFAEPFREIFLTAKSSKGKDLQSNFLLDAEANPASILEQAIAEWTDKQMIPSPFGGQQRPRTAYKVNVIRVVQDQTGAYVQERDQEGKYVVRVLNLPLSAYKGIIDKLANPMLNPQGPNGSPMSFMDINCAAPIHVQKPLPNTQSYRVEVYPMAKLPALVDGWQNELEDLKEHTTPTERLENGLQWVQAFIDMKNGVNPNARRQAEGGQSAPTAPATNPYAQTGQPTAPPVAPPATNQYTAPPAAPTAPPAQSYTPPTAPPVTAPPIQQPVTPPVPPTAPPSAGTDLNYDSVPDFGTPTPPAAPTTPQAPPVPTPPAAPAESAPTNGQGLPDIDGQLNNLLSGMNN